jgi:hypothetical protein
MLKLDIGPGVCREVDDIEHGLVCSTREGSAIDLLIGASRAHQRRG